MIQQMTQPMNELAHYAAENDVPAYTKRLSERVVPTADIGQGVVCLPDAAERLAWRVSYGVERSGTLVAFLIGLPQRRSRR